MTINVGVCAMTKIEDFGRIMSSDYALKILTQLNSRPTLREDICKLLGVKTQPRKNIVNYYLRKMTKRNLIVKERSVHTNEILEHGKLQLTPFGKKAYGMAVNVAIELNLPQNKVLLTKTGKVRLLK